MVDCSKVGNGIVIPTRINGIKHMTNDTKFILVVEKFTAFMKMADAQFYKDILCIVITGMVNQTVPPDGFFKN